LPQRPRTESVDIVLGHAVIGGIPAIVPHFRPARTARVPEQHQIALYYTRSRVTYLPVGVAKGQCDVQTGAGGRGDNDVERHLSRVWCPAARRLIVTNDGSVAGVVTPGYILNI